AIKRVFDKHGNRKNRNRARLRFLVEEIGIESFRDLYRKELAQLRITTPPREPVQTGVHAATTAGSDTAAAGFAAWRKAHVTPQKQDGYYTVEIASPLGVMESAGLRALADVVEQYGEGMLRATNWQDFVLRWVPADQLASLHAKLTDLGLGTPQPTILRRMVTCAGASTCRLGICLSRGLAKATAEALRASDLKLNNGTGDLSLHISGCPNACGRHPIAQIGFHGAARRINGRLVPHYVLQLGGKVEESRTALASGAIAIPARNVPAFLTDFLQAFEQSPQHPDFDAFLQADGRQIAQRIAQAHASIPSFEQDESYYRDWDATQPFSLAGRGPGECGAGVFDLIAVDLASAGEALKSGRLFSATALAARALLVTRGEQADDYAQAISLFRKHFVEPGLIPAPLHELIDRAAAAVAAADPDSAFRRVYGEKSSPIVELLAEVQKIYEGMGPSLRVAAPACGITPMPKPTSTDIAADLAVDYRGVSCPLNYVKTKMALAKIKRGQVLSVLLDEQGAKNVPASAANDGHEIVAVTHDTDHWRVVIRKGAS
ncbi:MAG: sulfurtransferase TusA family protein, partial [Bacillota bacterium]